MIHDLSCARRDVEDHVRIDRADQVATSEPVFLQLLLEIDLVDLVDRDLACWPAHPLDRRSDILDRLLTSSPRIGGRIGDGELGLAVRPSRFHHGAARLWRFGELGKQMLPVVDRPRLRSADRQPSPVLAQHLRGSKVRRPSAAQITAQSQVDVKQLEADADARRIRDARRERLRRAYKALVLGAISANEMVRNTRYILNIDETAERRDLRLGRMLAKAWRDLDTARIALMLETDGREVLDIFDQDVYRPFQRFQTASAIDKEAKGSISQDEFVRLIGLVAEGVERMVWSWPRGRGSRCWSRRPLRRFPAGAVL